MKHSFFGAGVFPAEGLYLYAVNAGNGKLLWKNDTYGRGGMGTVSPQGYMVASKERLFVPLGHSMPAAFSRKGLLWKINQLLQHVERTWTLVSDDAVDATNNATERVIGLTFKIRAKTMRGFKAERKVIAHPYLASLLRARPECAIYEK